MHTLVRAVSVSVGQPSKTQRCSQVKPEENFAQHTALVSIWGYQTQQLTEMVELYSHRHFVGLVVNLGNNTAPFRRNRLCIFANIVENGRQILSRMHHGSFEAYIGGIFKYCQMSGHEQDYKVTIFWAHFGTQNM